MRWRVAAPGRLFSPRAIAAALLAVVSTSLVVAQTTSTTSELPDSIRQSLGQIADFSFSYDSPALIALLEWLKSSGKSPGHASEPIVVERWTDLLERPADFRGLPVTITGGVGRNTSWRYQQPERQHLGEIHELQVSRDDQPIICKLVLTQPAGDIPVGATVTATGYFLTIQQFYSESKRLRQAAVLIGVGPTQVSQAAPRPPPQDAIGNRMLGVVAAITIGLVVAWMLLRRVTAKTPRDVHDLRARQPAPMNLSQDLSQWAEEQEPRRS